ncbi:hypothetical protein D1AOALGA4SA_9297 [Olavius algarvensis Delta 1 endosymbiont]|nr:hypothetical protein D1AOALGA4SA_9297 [Olavius algarvensis Delta 1 endosymbiont]
MITTTFHYASIFNNSGVFLGKNLKKHVLHPLPGVILLKGFLILHAVMDILI